MAIKNPEKECEKMPGNLSTESRIISVETADDWRGIVLESPEEFVNALIVYNGGSVNSARATQKDLMDNIGDMGGGIGAALLLGAGIANSGGFIEKLTSEALSELKSEKRFHRSFDYDAMGTNFFKTTVDCRAIKDKYVLELCAAYVGTKPENELAKKLGKPLALVSSNVRGVLSVVDDWWFNINLENVLVGLPIPKKQLKELHRYIASGGDSIEKPEITLKHDGQKFSLGISLDISAYLRPEGKKHGSEYFQGRGDNIVGGAWTTWDEKGMDKVDPRVIQPSVVVSVSSFGEKWSRQAAVTEKQADSIRSARDYIAALIKKN